MRVSLTSANIKGNNQDSVHKEKPLQLDQVHSCKATKKMIFYFKNRGDHGFKDSFNPFFKIMILQTHTLNDPARLRDPLTLVMISQSRFLRDKIPQKLR